MKKQLIFLLVAFCNVAYSQVISIGDASTYSSQYVYYYPNGWWTGIYEQSEIATAGDIYSLTVLPDIISDTYEAYNSQKIYIGHTTDTEFITKDIPDVASMTLVYSGSISFYDQQSLTIQFSAPFTYNNTDNLIIYWENKDGDYQRSIRFTATDATNKYLSSYAHTFQDTAVAIASNRADVALNFAKQYDIRPKELILPETDGDLTSTELMRVSVENMGYDPITSYDIKYSLDSGSTWSSGSFSGTLSPFTSSNFTFPSTADMSVETTYQVMVVTQLATDQITSNDTLYTEITHLPKGAKCSDPIVLTDPVTDLDGNTLETGNNYHYDGSVYCAPNYVGENDAIYSFTFTEDTDFSLRVDADRPARVGLHLLDGCPETTPTCLQWAGSSLPSGTLGSKLTPGTYYVVVSSFPGSYDWYYFWLDWDWTQDTDIVTFDAGTAISSTIDKVNHTIDIVLPNGTDVTNLTPDFTVPTGSSLYIGAAAQSSGVTTVDFSSPVVYTVKSSGDTYTQNWTVTVTADPNTAPTDITLDNKNVDENQPSDVVIGNLSTVDGTTGTYAYSLVAGAGDTDNASFQIENDVLKANAVFDFETKDTFEIRVQTIENGYYTFEKAFEVYINNTNENPIGLNLSSTTVSELAPIGTVVGVFTTDDLEGGSYTYSLVSGAGSTHNTSFVVDADSLKTAVALDAETLATMYVRAETVDSGGLDYATSFTITVSEQDEPPTDISLSNNSLFENNSISTLIGTLSSSDPEGGSFTYSLVAGAGDDDNASFSIIGNNLVAAEVFDKETKDTYQVRIETEDDSGLTYAESFSISVDNVNEAPDSIILSANTVNENTVIYTEIGALSATDPDDVTGFIFNFSAGAGDEDNDKFLISGGKLVTNASIDFESNDTLNVRLLVYDPSFLSHIEQLQIIVQDVNEAPTSIALSHSAVDENAATGTGIGLLSGADPEGDVLTFAFAAGTGDTDNALFAIDGDSLRTNAVFDFESQNTYQVRISVSDPQGESFENYFSISINDLFENGAPYGIDLTPGWVYENSPAGSAIGKLIAQDLTPTTYSYQLITGDGDDDNGLFYIDGDSIRANDAFDFETQSIYSIRVAANEDGGDTFERTFSVMIFNAFEAPLALTLSNDSIPEDIGTSELVGQLGAEGEDASYSFYYELASGEGDTDNGKFYVNSGYVYTNAVYDYNDQNSFSIRVRAFDDDGHSYEQIFPIYLAEVNEAPTGILLSANHLPEDEAAGYLIGEFTTQDVDDDTHTYSFVQGYDESFFMLSGNQLLSNHQFDYETQSTYSISVQSEDPSGASVVEGFTITIDDVADVITGIDEHEIIRATIYPNPTSETIRLNIKNSFIGSISLLVYDVSGKLQLTEKIEKRSASMDHTIDVRKLPVGVYELVLSFDEKLERLKLIKA